MEIENNPETDQTNQETPPPPPPPPPPPVEPPHRPLGPPWDESFDLLMVYEYKTRNCPPLFKLSQSPHHNPAHCPYLHPGQTRRRSLCDFYYKPEICSSIPHCKDGDQCYFAHNILEYCLHPRIFCNTRCANDKFHNCTTYPCLFTHSFRYTLSMVPPLTIIPPKPPPPARPPVCLPPLICRQPLRPFVLVKELKKSREEEIAEREKMERFLLSLRRSEPRVPDIGSIPFTPTPSPPASPVTPRPPPHHDGASTSGTK